MMDSGSDLIQELYCKMTYQGMRPKTIVDYTREPFIYEAGNVRVTFDYNIRTGLWVTDFLNPDCVTIPAGDYSPIILEVKWDEYLPSIIRDCVQTPGRHVTAFSKYAQCRLYGYNAIFNMAVTMQDDGDSTKLIVDAFTGGGKMGLSMPHGWFDTIVIMIWIMALLLIIGAPRTIIGSCLQR